MVNISVIMMIGHVCGEYECNNDDRACDEYECNNDDRACV